MRENIDSIARVSAGAFSFVSSNVRTLWKLTYVGAAGSLFIFALLSRYSLPLEPLADFDSPNYLYPALQKLSGHTFEHTAGLNFLYPGMLFLILRVCCDFRAIAVAQHALGILAGALLLLSWNRLHDFFPRSYLRREMHQAIGLFGAGVYLLSANPILLEMQIRSDAICMFAEMLTFWFVVQFFHFRLISLSPMKASAYGAGVIGSACLLASLKPSFALTALFVMAPVCWLMLRWPQNWRAQFAFFGAARGDRPGLPVARACPGAQ